MKRIVLKFAWWLDGVCHRLIEWADPLTDEHIFKMIDEWERLAQKEARV